MLTLAINTCQNGFDVAIKNNISNLIYYKQTKNQNTNELLHLYIQEIIKQQKLSFKNIENIIIAIGPGSFTGIRAGIATANGINLALNNIKLIPINIMKLCCFIARTKIKSKKYQVLVKEGNNFCYTQILDNQLKPIDKLKRISIKDIKKDDTITCGDVNVSKIKIDINIDEIILFGEYYKNNNIEFENLEPIYAY